MSKTLIDWERYQERLHRQGSTQRERVINRTKDSIRRDVYRNPACREVLIDDQPQYLYIYRTDSALRKAFNSLPDESVNLGSVVLWEGSHWLVTESMFDDNMTYRGAIELCNRQITWQNPETREIQSRWCTITKPYYSNLDETLHVTFSNREFKLQLPYDAESALLDLDKRFMLEVINGKPKCYRCASVDSNTERYDVNGESVGFLVLNLIQDEYNADTDSIEHGICNYLEPFDIIHESEGGYCVLEPNANGIVPGGLPLSITANFFDKAGLPMDVLTQWNVIAPLEADGYLTTDEEINKITLKLAYYSKLIGTEIRINASTMDGKISDNIVVKVVNAV